MEWPTGTGKTISTPMKLRDAQLSDLDLLQYWDSKPHVVAAMGDDEGWDWPAELGRRADWLDMLIAEEDGRPIGFIQIIDPACEETHYWGASGPAFAPSTSGSVRRRISGAVSAPG